MLELWFQETDADIVGEVAGVPKLAIWQDVVWATSANILVDLS
jgi:hypothetical protein